jgi:hypothetical protein
MKNLTIKKITFINLGVLTALAPLMIELSKHLPGKYLWLAPVLVQLGNWLIQHRALTTSNPNVASRKALVTAMQIAAERKKDAALVAHLLFGKELDCLTASQMSILIRNLKETRVVTGKPGSGTA